MVILLQGGETPDELTRPFQWFYCCLLFTYDLYYLLIIDQQLQPTPGTIAEDYALFRVFNKNIKYFEHWLFLS